MVNVRKADGTSQPFDRQKLLKTCIRMRAPPDVAERIVAKVERELYEGITTKKIFQLAFAYLKRYRPELKGTKDLRVATSLLRPKPDFEQLVALIMQAEGYAVKTNRILQGACVDHEIDVIAEKGKEVVYIEVKHHAQPHIYTGLDVFLEANSAFEDLKKGFHAGRNGTSFNKAMVVINTKISDHARRYSSCMNIRSIGWKEPPNGGLETMIEKHRLYPVTMIRGLDLGNLARLGDAGVFTLKQLAKMDERGVRKITNLPQRNAEDVISKAAQILSMQ